MPCKEEEDKVNREQNRRSHKFNFSEVKEIIALLNAINC